MADGDVVPGHWAISCLGSWVCGVEGEDENVAGKKMRKGRSSAGGARVVEREAHSRRGARH